MDDIRKQREENRKNMSAKDLSLSDMIKKKAGICSDSDPASNPYVT